jgi:nucleoid-associated protein YgaU
MPGSVEAPVQSNAGVAEVAADAAPAPVADVTEELAAAAQQFAEGADTAVDVAEALPPATLADAPAVAPPVPAAMAAATAPVLPPVDGAALPELAVDAASERIAAVDPQVIQPAPEQGKRLAFSQVPDRSEGATQPTGIPASEAPTVRATTDADTRVTPPAPVAAAPAAGQQLAFSQVPDRSEGAAQPLVADTEQSPAAGGTSDTLVEKEDTPRQVALFRANRDGVSLIEPGNAERPVVLERIALDTISYSETGDVQLDGRAREETVVRVYLDNRQITDLGTDGEGRWSGKLGDVKPGIYTLRLDEVGENGEVLSRIETPFKRESPEALAAPSADTIDGQRIIRAVTVQTGDTLWAISRERYGDGLLFVRVFEANKSAIRDPDLIYPGQVFTLPQ